MEGNVKDIKEIVELTIGTVFIRVTPRNIAPLKDHISDKDTQTICITVIENLAEVLIGVALRDGETWLDIVSANMLGIYSASSRRISSQNTILAFIHLIISTKNPAVWEIVVISLIVVVFEIVVISITEGTKVLSATDIRAGIVVEPCILESDVLTEIVTPLSFV